MQNDQIKNTLNEIRSFGLSPVTKASHDLFLLIEKSLNISLFVADVFKNDAKSALHEILWHFEHSAEQFDDTLKTQIQNQCLNNTALYNVNSALCMSDYKGELQNLASMMKWLRKSRKAHSAAIAVLELTGILSIEESSQRMSLLAENLTQIAYQWSMAFHQPIFGSAFHHQNENLVESQLQPQSERQPQNLLILAMGKFGGNELNFSSDIDLIFFYSSSGQTQGGKRTIDNNRFFQKVGVLLIKLLDEVTEDGFVFRVDMRLRPYGDSGNLVMSIDQAEDYYHEQGRGWERFAMVRARIITGRQAERKPLESILTPFAFRRYIDYGVIDSLRNMKEMIQREVRRKGLNNNIKLGAGGIREIEFMVQSLQLIQGGRDKRLQEKNVLKVLPLLVEVNLLPIKTSEELADNYRFLRRLEHCIQELDEKQTQELPEDHQTRKVIANLMNFDEWGTFKLALDILQKNTNDHFNALFGEEVHQNKCLDEFYYSLWESHVTAEQLNLKYSELTNVEAIKFIELLEKFKHSTMVLSLSARGAKRLKLFLPSLLEIILKTYSPIKTLNNLILVLKSILKRTAYLELLSENLPVLQHLVDLVSRSDWVVQRLSECPILLDELLYPNSLYEPLKSSDLHNELQQNLLRIDENDDEQILDAVRSFKQINELRVAAALLSERLSVSQVSRYLTELAQVIIQVATNVCWKNLSLKYGIPSELEPKRQQSNNIGFSVVAYGKLGGCELGFNSDLDLVFLFEQPLDSQTVSDNEKVKPISISRFYTRLSQKLIHFLSTRTRLGVLYEVDMRLRPSGNSGLLVSHVDSFTDYQNNSAWTWEHQALVRARVVAGDSCLNEKFNEIRHQVITKNRQQETLKTDVLNMRIKMRKELDKSKVDQIDLKQCVGGLVDIEFLSQYFILNISNKKALDSEGLIDAPIEKRVEEFIPSNTVEMIKFSQDHHQLDKSDSLILIKAYRKYRNCLNESALVGGDGLVFRDDFSADIDHVAGIWGELFGSPF